MFRILPSNARHTSEGTSPQESGEEDAAYPVFGEQPGELPAGARSPEVEPCSHPSPPLHAALGWASAIHDQQRDPVGRTPLLALEQRLQVGSRPGGEGGEGHAHGRMIPRASTRKGLVSRSRPTVVSGPWPG